jgi:nitroreductase
MLLLPDIDAWTAGITTNPTKGQLARSCSLLSLKAAATSNVPLGIDNDERHATSDVRNSYAIMSLDEAVLKRYSCKKFRRYQPQNTTIASIFVATSLPLENEPTLTRPEPERLLASGSDPSVIQRAIESLNLARRTPTAFNTQPYKVVLVSSPEQKMAVSQYCLGPNRQRVQDADCTVIFLADKQIMRTFPTFRKLIKNIGIVKKNRPLTTKAMLKLQFYISIFSSGYPFPRFISSTISFAVRTCMAWMHFVLKWFSYPLPSLSNAETWAARQVMMVAMTYMLACTARGLATIPMEGRSKIDGSFSVLLPYHITVLFTNAHPTFLE